MSRSTGAYKEREDRAAAEREARFKKIDDLLGQGYTVDQIAEDEFGVKRDSIARQAQRWGRPDLAKKFKTRW